MAGGEGTRLRPLTANQPKPMLPVGNRPIMEHIVRHIRDYGFKDIVVTVQFLASQVRNYFGDGADMEVDLAYATEPTPLGTAGSVRNAAEMLGETFVVISGDALTDIDLDEVVGFHRRRGALATVVLKRMPNPLEFGIVITNDDGRIERFLEKPHWGQVFSDTINTGIYVLEPEVFEHIPDGQPSDFAGDVFPKLLDQGAPLFGFVAEGYWEDVGSLEAYQRAHQDILDGRVKVDVRGFQVRPGVWLGEGAEVDPDAVLTAPVLIGDFTKVEAGARLREYSVVGSGVIVKRDAFLHRAIVHDNAYIGPGTSLRGCVVGRSADVKEGGRVEDGVVVGDNAHIGHGAILQPNVKVYPYKTVEPGAIVTKSIIWEGRGARGLFDENGVTGIGNVDLTPEMVLRVATAFGSTLKKGSRVTLGRDASRVSRALKRAIIAGLNSAGVTCEDLELAPAPSVRFSAARMGASGGMYVRTSPGDSQSVELAVFGGDGSDVDEATRRRIERTYYREEFRRAFGQEMGELRYPPRAVEHYAVALVHSLDDAVVRHRGFKVVIDAGGGHGLARPPAPLVQVEPGHPDRERPPRREPGRPHRGRAPGRPRPPGQAGHRLRGRPGRAVRRRRGADRPGRRARRHPRPGPGPAAVRRPDRADRGGRRHRPARLHHPAGRRPGHPPRPPGPRVQAGDQRHHARRPARRGGVRRRRGRGLRLPGAAPRLRRPAVVRQAAGAAGRPRHHPGGRRRRPARAVGGPPPGPDRLGAQGRGHAPARGGDQGPAGRRHRRGQGLPPAVRRRRGGTDPGGTTGSWSSPTPSSRSPTCGPRPATRPPPSPWPTSTRRSSAGPPSWRV